MPSKPKQPKKPASKPKKPVSKPDQFMLVAQLRRVTTNDVGDTTWHPVFSDDLPVSTPTELEAALMRLRAQTRVVL